MRERRHPTIGVGTAAWPAAIALAALLVALPVAAGDTGGTREFTRRFPVRVELAADSRILAVAAPAPLVPAELRPLLERAVARATFRTGEVDGVPRPSKLWVTVATDITMDGDDRMRATVRNVVGGGGLKASMWVARTPSLATAHGYGADIVARVVFSTDSRIDRDRTDVESVVLRPGLEGEVEAVLAAELSAHFREAVRRDLRDWRWIPDEVDGIGLRGEFRVPIRFPSTADRASQGPSGIHPLPAEFVPVAATAALAPPRLVSWRRAAAPPAPAAGDAP